MRQLHIRLEDEVMDKFKAKLEADHGHRANLTAVIQSWIEAYIDDRMEIGRGTA